MNLNGYNTAEKAITENYGKKGYWKQSAACKIAYNCKMSLKEAWELVNFCIIDFELRSKRRKSAFSTENFNKGKWYKPGLVVGD